MACLGSDELPLSPEVGRVDSPKASGVGKSGSLSLVNRPYPTPVAARLDLPHKGEGAGERTARARQMRKSLTPQEAKLWVQLRTLRNQGFHFRRQTPFKGYYLDFVCFKSRLVIEVDGGGHGDDAQADHDLIRDKVLKRAGFATLRVWNRDIDTNLDGVVSDILRVLGILPPSPEVGRVETSEAKSGVGKCGSSPSFAEDADYPTPVAARLDPPHKGEGGR